MIKTYPMMTTFDAFMLIPSSWAKKRAERHMKIQLPLRAKDAATGTKKFEILLST